MPSLSRGQANAKTPQRGAPLRRLDLSSRPRRFAGSGRLPGWIVSGLCRGPVGVLSQGSLSADVHCQILFASQGDNASVLPSAVSFMSLAAHRVLPCGCANGVVAEYYLSDKCNSCQRRTLSAHTWDFRQDTTRTSGSVALSQRAKLRQNWSLLFYFVNFAHISTHCRLTVSFEAYLSQQRSSLYQIANDFCRVMAPITHAHRAR